MKTVQQFERLGASQRHNASPRLSIAAVAAPIDRAIWFGPFCLRPAAHLLLEADRPVHIGVRATRPLDRFGSVRARSSPRRNCSLVSGEALPSLRVISEFKSRS